jgi:hypothetical protein
VVLAVLVMLAWGWVGRTGRSNGWSRGHRAPNTEVCQFRDTLTPSLAAFLRRIYVRSKASVCTIEGFISEVLGDGCWMVGQLVII